MPQFSQVIQGSHKDSRYALNSGIVKGKKSKQERPCFEQSSFRRANRIAVEMRPCILSSIGLFLYLSYYSSIILILVVGEVIMVDVVVDDTSIIVCECIISLFR